MIISVSRCSSTVNATSVGHFRRSIGHQQGCIVAMLSSAESNQKLSSNWKDASLHRSSFQSCSTHKTAYSEDEVFSIRCDTSSRQHSLCHAVSLLANSTPSLRWRTSDHCSTTLLGHVVDHALCSAATSSTSDITSLHHTAASENTEYDRPHVLQYLQGG